MSKLRRPNLKLNTLKGADEMSAQVDVSDLNIIELIPKFFIGGYFIRSLCRKEL